MEKLKDHISKKIQTDQENVNEEFTREIHFKIVSDLNQIKDPNFGDQNVPNTRRSSYANGSMEFQEGDEIDSKSNKSGGNSTNAMINPEISVLENFIKDQIKENQNVPSPPIRVLMVGDDKQFNKFVSQYVNLLDLDSTSKSKNQKMKGQDGSGNADINDNGGGFSLDRQKLDVRVFLVPQNENTLAHYLAMYDDLYCQNIYNFFNANPMLNLWHAQNVANGGDQKGKAKDF